MLTEKEIDRINRFLKNKTFTYKKGVFGYDLPGENDFDFKFQILGYKKMISVGEYYDYTRVSVTLLNFRDELSQMLFLKRFTTDFLKKYFKENLYHFRHSLNSEITDILTMFDNDVRVAIEDIDIESPEDKETLQEQKMTRQPIRTVVKDIVNILKKNQEGEFYLPNNDEGRGYEFGRLPFEFTVELYVEHNSDIEGFKINAEYSHSDEVIEIKIIYNPSDLLKNMYDILGELNEILAHELEHGLQNYRGEFTTTSKAPTNPLKYYLQPHEIPAQIAGFKRLARLRRQPIDKIIYDWFNTHRDIHNLNKKEEKIVIDKLLSYIR